MATAPRSSLPLVAGSALPVGARAGLLALLLLPACTTTSARSRDLAAPGDAAVGDAALATDGANPDMGSRMDPQRAAALATFVTGKMSTAHLPGLAAGIVKDGALAWAEGYGWASIEDKRPVTADTLFMIASVSKTLTAAGAASAVEEGLVDLDADVNAYLPFAVRNPHAPSAPITPRMLLAHTSSIVDNVDVLLAGYVEGDSPVALGDFLRDYLTSGGKHWSASRNWDADPPNTRYEYTDVGISLAAYVVERATGRPFDEWCGERLFAPLGMAGTSWHLAGVDPSNLAMPYGWTSAKGYSPYGHYGYPDYPDGQLRTSVRELSRYLRMFIGDGQLDGKRVLAAATVAEMKKIQFPSVDTEQAMAWWYEERDGQSYCGHTGRDAGASSQMFFRVADGVGVIVLTNGDVDEGTNAEKALLAIEERLFTEAEHL